jgi:hypothetical protein
MKHLQELITSNVPEEEELNSNQTLRTDSIRNDIKEMERVLFKILQSKLDDRKFKLHSAILEDGIIDESSMVIGPWLQFQQQLRYELDINLKDTMKTMAICFLVAKFGAHGDYVSRGGAKKR